MIIGNPGVTPGNRKIVIRIWVIAIIFIQLLGFYVHTVCTQMSYWKYKNNVDNYIIVDAAVVAMKKIQIYYNDTFPVFKINKVKLEYQINEETFYLWTTVYSDYSEGNHLKIAVLNSDFYVVERMVPYKLSKYAKQLYLKYIIFDVVLATILGIWWASDRRKQREALLEYNLKYGEKTNFEQQAQKAREDIVDKREKILAFLGKNKETLHDGKAVKSTIPVHEDFLWCLQYLAQARRMEDILLIDTAENGEYKYVVETRKLRQQGLPEQYYVIAIADNNCLCGNANLGRVYCFSQSLGITNTPYATVYDYIMEQIGLR